MIQCPNCKNNNLAGTIFCSECGTQLISSEHFTTQSISADNLGNISQNWIQTAPFQSNLPDDTFALLHLIEMGNVLALNHSDEFTLGRISGGQPIMPDIDLEPFNGYQLGVSRLHAVLKTKDKKIILLDLGSSNGTYLNGSRIQPHDPHELRHGDIISLGKLKIQVLFP